MTKFLKSFIDGWKKAKKKYPDQTADKTNNPDLNTSNENNLAPELSMRNDSDLAEIAKKYYEAAKKNEEAAKKDLEAAKKDLEAANKQRETSKKTRKVSIFLCVLSGIFVLLGPVISSKISARSNERIAKGDLLEENSNGDYGALLFRERALYTINNEKYKNVVIRPFPYEAYSYFDKKSIADNPTFTVEATVKNVFNHQWYRLAGDVHQYPGSISGQAFVFSDRLKFIKEAAIISWEWCDENVKGQQFPCGQPLSIQGAIYSTNPITKVSLTIESDATKQDPKEVTFNESEYIYSFSVETSKLNDLQFENLSVRNDYRLILTVSFLCNGGKTVESKQFIYPFEIINSP